MQVLLQVPVSLYANMEEQRLSFIKRLKLSKNNQFGANADIYMHKKWWNSAACDVNQWDLYNSRADTDIKWSKYLSLYLQ